jgi:hypothetical protein
LTRKLYVLNQSGDPRVADFFSCILGDSSNFNALTNTYPRGKSLDWGGQVQRNDNPCASAVGSQSFFECAVEAGQFDVRTSDVVLVIYPNGEGYGGENGTADVTNPLDGSKVTIQSAYVASSPNWIYQTVYGMHEVFEAATDGVSADCCNGETSTGGPFPWCPGCGAWDGGKGACGRYATGGSVGSLSIATIECPSGTFYYQQVSDQSHEFDGTCRALHLNGGHDDPCTSTSSCNTIGADPCAGVSPANDGVYCGGSRESGFAGGSTNTLYTCAHGKTAREQPCALGCYVAPPGTPDACNPDPCANVSSANDGIYCGKSNENGFGGGYANELYTCENGKTATTQVCPDTCYVAPPGKPDSCSTRSADGGTN